MLDLEHSKLPWHPLRVNQWLDGERIPPVTVDLALTRSCNMKCCYCYSTLQENEGKPWTWEMIEDTLRTFAEIGVRGVSLVSDGESTLNPYWQRAVVFGKRFGLDMALGTNGYMFCPTYAVLNALTYLRFNISAATVDGYTAVHGCRPDVRERVIENVRLAVSLKREFGFKTTIGIQQVFNHYYEAETIPLVALAYGLGVDYMQIKHCSDDEDGRLGVDYEKNRSCWDTFAEAERFSTERFQVIVKRGKIERGNIRTYSRCLAPPFHLQISGSGLVAPCGMFFNERYADFHLGNLHEQTFKDIWESEHYWKVMRLLASDEFDAQTQCGCLCLQDASNIWLDTVTDKVATPKGEPPEHVNFI